MEFFVVRSVGNQPAVELCLLWFHAVARPTIGRDAEWVSGNVPVIVTDKRAHAAAFPSVVASVPMSSDMMWMAFSNMSPAFPIEDCAYVAWVNTVFLGQVLVPDAM